MRTLGKGAEEEPGPAPQGLDTNNFAQGARKQLLGRIVRETLEAGGMPLDWLSAEALQAVAPGRMPGTHVRFMILRWLPELLVYCVAFQAEVKRRLLEADPAASAWFMGCSWQFALPRDTQWPTLPVRDVADQLTLPKPLDGDLGRPQ